MNNKICVENKRNLTGFAFSVACGVWQSRGRAGEVWNGVNGKWRQVVCSSLLGVWMISWYVQKTGRKKKKKNQNKTKTMSIYSRENLALQLILQLCYNCNVTECEMMDPCISDR